ncbi:MAG: polysaccharide deacetylase family protein [Kiloniellaceae bacterium]
MAHVDDLGMCHGATVAFEELSRMSFITSGSVMVPCPWFPEVAALAADRPELDVGVHLTLSSEKRFYRWRPITASSASSGLVDDSGYMWSDLESLRKNVVPKAAEEELRAQVDRALATGIDVTHLDAHMGAMMLPELVDIYLGLGRAYKLPVMFPRTIRHYDIKHNLGDMDQAFYESKAAEAAADGHFLFDRVFETPWQALGDPMEVYCRLFAAAPMGISFFALHCNAPGAFEAIAPDEAQVRFNEYRLFRDRRFIDFVEGLDVEFIGFRAIREMYRSRLAS